MTLSLTLAMLTSEWIIASLGSVGVGASAGGGSSNDRSGEAVRVFKVKQLIKLVMHAKGSGARARLERSFRLADKVRWG